MRGVSVHLECRLGTVFIYLLWELAMVSKGQHSCRCLRVFFAKKTWAYKRTIGHAIDDLR